MAKLHFNNKRDVPFNHERTVAAFSDDNVKKKSTSADSRKFTLNVQKQTELTKAFNNQAK